MNQLALISFTVFLSLLLYVTAVRNSLEVTYHELRGNRQRCLIFWDVVIIVGHAVGGAIVADLIFQLDAMTAYREYTVLGTIFIGLSFKGVLPTVVSIIQRKVLGRVKKLG